MSAFLATRLLFNICTLKSIHQHLSALLATCLLFHIFFLDQAKVVDIRRNRARMITRIMLLCFLLTHGREQKDRTFELSAPAPIRHRDVGVIVWPVRWSSNTLLIAQLKGLYTTHNLIHIPTHTGWVIKTKHKLVLRVDNEDSADCKWKLLLIQIARIDHAIGDRNGSVLITNDWELDINFILAMSNDIFEPVLLV